MGRRCDETNVVSNEEQCIDVQQFPSKFQTCKGKRSAASVLKCFRLS